MSPGMLILTNPPYSYHAKLSRRIIEACKLISNHVDWSRPWTNEEILKEIGYEDKDR